MRRAKIGHSTNLPLLLADHSGRAVSSSLFQRGGRACLQPFRSGENRNAHRVRGSEQAAFLTIAGLLPAADRTAVLAHFLGASNAEVGRYARLHRANVSRYLERLAKTVGILTLARYDEVGAEPMRSGDG
jgi:hypothetical protein